MATRQKWDVTYKLQKAVGNPYSHLYLTIWFEEEGSLAATMQIDWMSSEQNREYGWFAMNMSIKEDSPFRFYNALAKGIVPLIKKMDAQQLIGSSVKPLEVFEFLDKQKIHQVVFCSGSKILLKDLRKNNLYEVRDLREAPTVNPYCIIADSELDATYIIKKRYGNPPPSLDSFKTRKKDASEYEDLFQMSWRSTLGADVKKEE